MLQRGCTAYSPLQTFARKEEWNGDSNNRSTPLQPDNVTIIRGRRGFIESWCRPTGSCRVCECIQFAGHFRQLEEVINRDMGKTHLMLFLEFDHGAVLRKETGLNKPKMVRLVIGNPLVMKEMAKHVPDAGSYAPVTVLVDEREDGVHLSYDKMVSFLSPDANQDALAIAHDLDHKIVKLLNDAAVE